MPIQLQRLLIVFAIFIAAMFGLKYLLTPESWREYGPYRGYALVEIADKEAKFVQTETCAMCHDSIAELKNQGPHVSLECELCHGPGYLHTSDANEPEDYNMEIPQDEQFCMRCHSINAASPKNIIKQIDAAEHSEGEECKNCHNPHEPWL